MMSNVYVFSFRKKSGFSRVFLGLMIVLFGVKTSVRAQVCPDLPGGVRNIFLELGSQTAYPGNLPYFADHAKDLPQSTAGIIALKPDN